LPGAREQRPKGIAGFSTINTATFYFLSTSTTPATPKTDLPLRLRGRRTVYIIYFNYIGYNIVVRDSD
jgi:hypothetical protein